MWWNPSSHDPAIWHAPLEEDPPLSREELQMRENQYHVERVADIVPYWIKCVDAAAKGEELRLEPFLNTLEDASHSWIPSDDPWVMGSGGWGDSGDAVRWGVHPDVESVSSSAHYSKTHTGSRTISTSDDPATRAEFPNAYAFVENIARQEAADAERKRRMHKFFEVGRNICFQDFKRLNAHRRCLHTKRSRRLTKSCGTCSQLPLERN